MSPDDPRHGTYAGFQVHAKTDKSPCEPCRAAQRRYFKRLKFRLDNGHRERVVLGQDAWDVIHSMSRATLARKTGLSPTYLSRLHTGGEYQKVYVRTRAKILAAATEPTPVGIQRRMRALYVLGHSWHAIERESGIHREAISRIAHGEPPKFVRAYVIDALVGTYERLHMTLPESTRSVTMVRNKARRLKWASPMAWDSIDNPAERPKGVGQSPATGKHRDLLAEVAHLRSLGVAEHVIAGQLGVTVGAIERAEERAREREAS